MKYVNIYLIFNNMKQSFGGSIYTGKNNIDKAEIDQTNPFNNKFRPRSKEDKVKNNFWECKCFLWRLKINS